MKRITVITPSFNQGRYLEQTLRSVIGQGYAGLEYFVMDGGSGDGSRAIIERYADRLTGWCCEKDGGQAAAINKALRQAGGEVVGWINSDDVLLPGALAAVDRAFEDERVMWVSGWIVAIDPRNQIIDRKVYPQVSAEVLMKRSVLPQPGVFWRRGAMEKVGLLDEGLRWCMDLDYWLRLAKAGYQPRLIRRYQAGFRVHERQKTNAADADFQAELAKVFTKHCGGVPDRRDVPGSWKRRYRMMKWAMKLGWMSTTGIQLDGR
ncbi:MAG: glycosyltransferase family 2 protein [Phycisphaerales bacterium]